MRSTISPSLNCLDSVEPRTQAKSHFSVSGLEVNGPRW